MQSNSLKQSAFIAMRAKPAPATFSTKALSFYNSEYPNGQQPGGGMIADSQERLNYATHDHNLSSRDHNKMPADGEVQ